MGFPFSRIKILSYNEPYYERIVMLNLRKRSHTFDTVRAEELQFGDRFVFDNRAVKVAYSIVIENETVVLMETTHLGCLRTIISANLPNEMFISIARR